MHRGCPHRSCVDKYINDTEYWESCILVIGDYEFVVPEGIYSKTHIGDTTTLKYFYDNGRLLRVQFGDIDGRKADGDQKHSRRSAHS